MALKDIIVRRLRDEDMLEVSEWFKDRKWVMPPQPNMLPAETGYVSELDGELLAVAWLYLTNSGVGIITWIASNPKFKTKGIISVRKIIKHITNVAEESGGGVTAFLSLTSNDKLSHFFRKKCGFSRGEKVNMDVLVF